jgi:hypothetical protein
MHEAQELVAWIRDAGREALPALGEELKRRAIEAAPPSDPEHDPDPNVSLRDLFEVRVYGDFVSVTNTAPYAAKQHEALQFKHPHGGGAKFLERPATELAAELDHRFGAVIQSRSTSGRTRVRGA